MKRLVKKQKRGFFLAFVLIAGISVLEVITLVVDGLPPGYRWLNITANYLGFGLSPAVCHLSCICPGQENSPAA